MGRRAELINSRFGELTIIAFAEKDVHNRALWLCICDCGKIRIASTRDLTLGYAKSCGYDPCAGAARSYMNGSRGLAYKNGKRSRLNVIWMTMKQRCFNPKNSNFKNYGGRGITVCSEWLLFRPFYDWAIANGYEDNLTIERVNNDGNYCPENCTWIPKSQQVSNRRKFKRRGSDESGKSATA